MTRFLFLTIALVGLFGSTLQAQSPVATPPASTTPGDPATATPAPTGTPMHARNYSDDHFWRKRVILRVDMTEKANNAFRTTATSTLYGKSLVDEDGRPSESRAFGESIDGFIPALIRAWKNGRTAYDPDNLTTVLPYRTALDKWMGKAPAVVATAGTGAGAGAGEVIEGEEGEDALGLDDVDTGGGEDPAAATTDTSAKATGASDDTRFGDDQGEVFELIEDRFFDKIRSAMVYKILYIRTVQPAGDGGAPPEKTIAAFKYKDYVDILDNVLYRNRANDAQPKSIKQILDLHAFSYFLTRYSGSGQGGNIDVVNTLAESELRKKQMVEFEHHLWSY
jgi:hypothetical protein